MSDKKQIDESVKPSDSLIFPQPTDVMGQNSVKPSDSFLPPEKPQPSEK